MKSYELWLAECDRLITEEFGLGMDDFADWNWRDAWVDESEPSDAVELFKEELEIYSY